MSVNARVLTLLLASAAGLAQLARAGDAWPARPVHVVVPFAPGGGTDIVARTIGQRLAARLKQSVVIDNKPGAATVIGADAVVRAEPDGHTLLMSGSSTYTVNPALRRTLPYDPGRDLVTIAIVAKAPVALLVKADSPWRSVADLVAAAKAAPGRIDYSSFGPGSAPHLAGSLFALAAGVRLQDIPYKGSAPALTALMGGEIPLGIDTVAAAIPHVRAGTLRALAVVGSRRASAWPDVPTLAELGLPEASFDAWYALAAPGATDPALQQRIGRELAAVMDDAELQAQLRAQALDPVFIGPAAARRQMDDEVARYRALAHRVDIVVD